MTNIFLPESVKFLAMLVGQTAGVGGVAVGITLDKHFTAETKKIYMHTDMFSMVLWILLPHKLLRVYLNERGAGKHLGALTACDVLVLTKWCRL